MSVENLRCSSEHQIEAKNNDGSWDLADLGDLRLVALPRRYNAPLSTFKRHYADSLHSIPFTTFMHLRHRVQGLKYPQHPLAWSCNDVPHTHRQILNIRFFICMWSFEEGSKKTHRKSAYIFLTGSHALLFTCLIVLLGHEMRQHKCVSVEETQEGEKNRGVERSISYNVPVW